MFPLLSRYNIKATIFVNPEFVDPSTDIRPNLLDLWEGRINKNSLHSLGFLNWPEILMMQNSGLIDIQSHTMSHDWVFSSDKLIDIYNGQKNYDWLSWLIKPKEKYDYMNSNQEKIIPYGYPVFEHSRALGTREYKPSQDFVNYAVSLANQDKQYVLANKDNIISRLKDYGESEGTGCFESKKEQVERYRYEIFESKRILESKLQKPVDFLCWPGGGYDDLCLDLSKKANYKASTLPSSKRDTEHETDNKFYKRIKRFSSGGYVRTNSRTYYPNKKRSLYYSYLAKTGSIFHLNYNRCIKYTYILREYINNKISE